ncbi:Receptor-type tyrosine-protein phosphatase alpha, partial [Stegodyphus mimosarum]
MQAAYLLENQEKNRYMHILPADFSRPFLPRNYENTGYINAVFVDGYSCKNAYIATQYPLPQTILDFWNMIYEIKSTVIVLLQDIDFQDSKNPQLWPSTDLEVFGNLQIECQCVKTEDNTIVRELYLRISSEMEEKESLSVNIFQVLNWPVTDNLPSDTSSLLSVLKKIKLSQCKLPITVICLDGATACGIFCAALYLCDRIQSEQEVDIFQAVKCIKVNRPQFISN